MKKKSLLIKWLFCLIPAIVAAIMYFVLPFFPEFTEYVVTRGIFRIFAFPLEWLVSLLPFSITELVVIFSVPALLTLLTIWIIRIIRSPQKGKTVERGIRFVAWCLSFAFLIFMITDGANFSRIPTAELFDLPERQYTAEDLYKVTVDLAKKASSSRGNLPEDEQGCVKLSVSQSEMLTQTDECYKNLRKTYPFLKNATFRVKPVIHSHLWSYTGTTGVYCPWLGEANVNVDVPAHELGHTAAHELAHTIGFAKENECNFIAWLACSVSEYPEYTYSGHQQAFIYCSNALYRADKNLWKKAYSACSQGMIRDIQKSNTYWKSFEGEIKETSQKLNDTFIKVNGVESGVLSYNQMVELMLRYYDKQGLLD